jgi:hypothetical protein
MLSVLFFLLDNLSDVEELCACRQRNGRTKYIKPTNKTWKWFIF